MATQRRVTAAVAQIGQEFMNTRANLDAALRMIEQAGEQGADIVAFSEGFLGQFPYWSHYYDVPAANFARAWNAYYENAVSVKGPEIDAIRAAARKHRIHVVMGCNELSDEPGSASTYNTMVFIDRRGDLLGRHRKLMPTYAERIFHGRGDGRDLRVHSTDIGNVGGLICWENHMTPAKYAMQTLGEEIHVASWPGMWRGGDPEKGERSIEPDRGTPFVCDAEFAVREYAMESGNFVLSASSYFPPEKVSDEWRSVLEPAFNIDWAIGGSSIVAPGGGYLVSPVIDSEELLVAELDFAARQAAKAFFDPMGHYARPDVFSLQLHDPEGRERMTFATPEGASAPMDAIRPKSEAASEAGEDPAAE